MRNKRAGKRRASIICGCLNKNKKIEKHEIKMIKKEPDFTLTIPQREQSRVNEKIKSGRTRKKNCEGKQNKKKIEIIK